MEEKKISPFPWLRQTIPKFLPDILVTSGAGAIIYGVAMLSIPFAWIMAGALLIAAAVIFSKGGVGE